MIWKRITFRYSLGDLCLFRIGFNASRIPASFPPTEEPLSQLLTPPALPDGADVVVRSGVLLPHRLPALSSDRNAICYVRNQTTNYYIDLNCSFDEYLSSFSSKTRNTLLRKVRKLEGTTEFRSFRTPDEARAFHALAREVAVKTYQERLFDGAIPASPEFVERIRALAEGDSFRGYILLSNGQPVSYLYLPAEGEVLTYGYLGYDPAYANLSVGTVLFYLAIRNILAERRFRYFDFTYGEGQHKQLFGRESFLRADLYFFRKTVRNTLAVYAHILIDRFSSALGRTLDALKLRQAFRKLLRNV